MTTYTPNYEFGMQENKSDKFDMGVITVNAMKLDSILKDMQDQIDNLTRRVEELERSY